jgi:hypothetical protein
VHPALSLLLSPYWLKCWVARIDLHPSNATAKAVQCKQP